MTPTPPDSPVQPARPSELSRTARLHRRHLPDGFFARLGPRFLRRYHQAFAQSPEAEVFVLRSSAGPQGVLVGTFDNAAHYRWALRHRGLPLFAVGLVALVARPRLAVEFLRTRVGRYLRALARLLRPGRGVAPVAESESEPRRVAVLTHVAVAPEARGNGSGRELVRSFVAAARRRGADEVRLITPTDGPGPAFYASLGWQRLTKRRASDGTIVEEFKLPL